MLPPKITLTSPSTSRYRDQLNDVLLSAVLALLVVVASSYDPEKFCTLLDHALRCDGSHTTSLRRQGNRKASSPSGLRVATDDSYDSCDPCDHCGSHDRQCWPPDRPVFSLWASCHIIHGARLEPQRP
jgi:hypothetical protein